MLGKVAMGIMVAKTVGKAMGGSGGVGDMLGGLLGGNKNSNTNSSSQGGGLGDLLGSLTGGNSQQGGLGDLLSSALEGKNVNAAPSEEEKAKVILKAMIAAAKADGHLDADEQAKITQHIADVTPEELAFVKAELSAPLDVDSIINSVPKGMEQEVYLMSLLTINLDSNEEAHYLDKLAKGLHISQDMANAIHQKVGAAPLYR
jgi:uncharacterized membrane protein YebE (DUF533 family)